MLTSFKGIDINDLVDIQNVEIDGNLPKAERVKSYIDQIGNPYLYRCDNVIVRVSFSENGETLEALMENLILSL